MQHNHYTDTIQQAITQQPIYMFVWDQACHSELMNSVSYGSAYMAEQNNKSNSNNMHACMLEGQICNLVQQNNNNAKTYMHGIIGGVITLQ